MTHKTRYQSNHPPIPSLQSSRRNAGKHQAGKMHERIDLMSELMDKRTHCAPGAFCLRLNRAHRWNSTATIATWPLLRNAPTGRWPCSHRVPGLAAGTFHGTAAQLLSSLGYRSFGWDLGSISARAKACSPRVWSACNPLPKTPAAKSV